MKSALTWQKQAKSRRKLNIRKSVHERKLTITLGKWQSDESFSWKYFKKVEKRGKKAKKSQYTGWLSNYKRVSNCKCMYSCVRSVVEYSCTHKNPYRKSSMYSIVVYTTNSIPWDPRTFNVIFLSLYQRK